jgi:hypothetical protein
LQVGDELDAYDDAVKRAQDALDAATKLDPELRRQLQSEIDLAASRLAKLQSGFERYADDQAYKEAERAGDFDLC